MVSGPEILFGKDSGCAPNHASAHIGECVGIGGSSLIQVVLGQTVHHCLRKLRVVRFCAVLAKE